MASTFCRPRFFQPSDIYAIIVRYPCTRFHFPDAVRIAFPTNVAPCQLINSLPCGHDDTSFYSRGTTKAVPLACVLFPSSNATLRNNSCRSSQKLGFQLIEICLSAVMIGMFLQDIEISQRKALKKHDFTLNKQPQ